MRGCYDDTLLTTCIKSCFPLSCRGREYISMNRIRAVIGAPVLLALSVGGQIAAPRTIAQIHEGVIHPALLRTEPTLTASNQAARQSARAEKEAADRIPITSRCGSRRSTGGCRRRYQDVSVRGPARNARSDSYSQDSRAAVIAQSKLGLGESLEPSSRSRS